LVNAVKKTRDSEAAKADKFPVCDPCLHWIMWIDAYQTNPIPSQAKVWSTGCRYGLCWRIGKFGRILTEFGMRWEREEIEASNSNNFGTWRRTVILAGNTLSIVTGRRFQHIWLCITYNLCNY
jgi:hypothetical protein